MALQSNGIAAALLLVLSMTPASAANQWILNNFADLRIISGAATGVTTVIYPSMVLNATCSGGNACYTVFECDPTNCTNPNYNDQRVAFVDTFVGAQVPDGKFGSAILINGDAAGWNDMLDVFLSNVTLAPDWPDWIDYSTTNLDGITLDAGWPDLPTRGGHVYAEDVTVACPSIPPVSCWAEAALDVKPLALQAVRLHTEGGGINTLKLWQPGPHYIINSIINNDRYVEAPPIGTDGGLVWSWDCSKLVLNIYNSTFNGSATLARNMITCEVPGNPTINYLIIDPTTTGEMHQMFTH